jgi:PIN domain nuclease of toxin-antitoxin system
VKLLLDTQVFVWMLMDPDKLAPRTRSELEDADNELMLSAASVWELANKYRESTLLLPVEPRHYLPAQMAKLGINVLDITASHVIQCAELALYHRDQVDRLLIAQGIVEQIPLVTPDPVFKRYPVQVVWA